MIRAAALATMAGVVGTGHAQLFQPDSGVASSTFSGSYDIGNTIDGSGLPAGFGPESAHANYAANNHWTTARRPATPVTGDFFFDAPVTIGTLHLWNHRSNAIADDPFYAVKTFDLVFFDAADAPLGSISGLSAERNVAIAQSYAFAPVEGVSRVQFTIVENHGSVLYGFAEIAFESIPSPSAAAVLGLSGLVLTRRRR